jgi:hypothetical protein
MFPFPIFRVPTSYPHRLFLHSEDVRQQVPWRRWQIRAKLRDVTFQKTSMSLTLSSAVGLFLCPPMHCTQEQKADGSFWTRSTPVHRVSTPFSALFQKLALTSPTSGGRSVGILRLRTAATEFSLYVSL